MSTRRKVIGSRGQIYEVVSVWPIYVMSAVAVMAFVLAAAALALSIDNAKVTQRLIEDQNGGTNVQK